MSSIVGSIIFGIIAIMTILVACGFPLGEYTLGGRFKVLPPNMRMIAGVSFVIQLIAIISILQTGGFITTFVPFQVAKGSCYFFAAYLSINVIMNTLSESPKEKYVMTPLSAVAAACFWLTAIFS